MARKKKTRQSDDRTPAPVMTGVEKLYYSILTPDVSQLPPPQNRSGKVALLLHSGVTGGMERALLRTAYRKYGEDKVVVVRFVLDPTTGTELPTVSSTDLRVKDMRSVKVAITAFPQHMEGDGDKLMTPALKASRAMVGHMRSGSPMASHVYKIRHRRPRR